MQTSNILTEMPVQVCWHVKFHLTTYMDTTLIALFQCLLPFSVAETRQWRGKMDEQVAEPCFVIRATSGQAGDREAIGEEMFFLDGITFLNFIAQD